MRTPMNVMVEVETLQKLDKMASAKGKTRTGMVTELITGTSFTATGLETVILSWFDECDGVDKADVERLIKTLASH